MSKCEYYMGNCERLCRGNVCMKCECSGIYVHTYVASY